MATNRAWLAATTRSPPKPAISKPRSVSWSKPSTPGDRAANNALHTIALVRLTTDRRTR